MPGDRLRVAMTMLQCWHRVPGGTAVAAIRQAEAIAADPTIDLVAVGPMGWRSHGRPAPHHWAPPMPVSYLPGPYQLIYDAWDRLRIPPISWAIGDVDVVHATTVTVPPHPRRGALVVTIHDIFPITRPEHLSPRGVRLLSHGIERARETADAVLVSSEYTATQCREIGFSDDQLHVVPLGVEPVVMSPTDIAAVRQRHGLDRRYVMWAGTVEPRKNLSTLLEAFASVGRDADLLLAGPTGWQVDLEALMKPLGDRVRRVGFVERRELMALYAGAEMVCLPSLEEGFGLTALESMSVGTPVLASDNSAMAEVGGSAVVALPATDVGAWAAAIGDLLDDPDRRIALSAAGLERASSFTWERTGALTIDVYHHVAERNEQTSPRSGAE